MLASHARAHARACIRIEALENEVTHNYRENTPQLQGGLTIKGMLDEQALAHEKLWALVKEQRVELEALRERFNALLEYFELREGVTEAKPARRYVESTHA